MLLDENLFLLHWLFVEVSETGERTFSFARKPGADTRLSFEEIDLAMIDEASVFHFGTLSLTDDPVRTATEKIVWNMRRDRENSHV